MPPNEPSQLINNSQNDAAYLSDVGKFPLLPGGFSRIVFSNEIFEKFAKKIVDRG